MIAAMSEWKVNKEINIGEILTVITMLAVVVGFFVIQDRRIEGVTSVANGNRNDITELKAGQVETNNKIESLRLENKADMNRLDTKLDDIKNLIIQESRKNAVK